MNGSRVFKYLCVLAFLFTKAFAEVPLITYASADNNIELGNKVQLLEDKDDNLTIDQVLRSDKFVTSNNRVPNLGLSTSAFWIKIQIKNATALNQLLLELSQPTMDLVDLYSPGDDGRYRSKRLSETFPFSARKYKDPDYIFDLNINLGETKTYFLKIKGSEQVQVTLLLGSSKSIFEHIKSRDIASGLYFGIMLVMILYNLFIYFTVNDKSYMYYVIYIILILLTQTSVQGYPFQYLWPNWTWMEMHSSLFPSLVGIAGLMFMNHFLHASEYEPRLIKLRYLFYGIYSVSISCALLNKYALSYKIMEANAMAVSLYMLYIPIRIYKKGYRPAKFFLLAWTIFLVGICAFIIKDFGILPYNNYTRYTMQVGSAFEVILLSFGLADRINILKKEKEESQAQELATSMENERIVKEQNIILESKVKERTEELVVANKDLHVVLTNLKQTQAQLVDAEKMASLGQLTAGIAHEINNPINFVLANVKPLRRDIGDVLSLIEKYGEIIPETNLKEKLAEIKQLKTALDVDYLISEISALLQGIDEGAMRTSEIVRSLKNFSRLDEDDLKRTNINDGLESTLTLLSSKANHKIKISKELGKIPDIECYPGKLNQVFMNIMNNAIQAIIAKGISDGEMKITSALEGTNIKISIKDNGIGMTESIKARIFEPFYTTKDVGEGSGLGLSIVYGIIEKHKGQIQVESTPGVGSEFIILLPMLLS